MKNLPVLRKLFSVINLSVKLNCVQGTFHLCRIYTVDTFCLVVLFWTGHNKMRQKLLFQRTYICQLPKLLPLNIRVLCVIR